MLQKKRRIWKNTLRVRDQEKEEEGSPEKVGNEEEEGMAKRVPKKAQGI